ncbi:hypothetical protein [Caenimonas aquaedulcis]|uniref:Uncharacterized protein n=1 Tax=Caenimonas aquaedulcis TaxID=2793270 RepID=A0A931MFU1_9BURK|nr:hypothetical protein [Caenimonas aquaedulcis]MBG9387543.1 hypothetical protein [Caenimonas aquaedulcis]
MSTYLPAALVAWWFLSVSRLKSRLPIPYPGGRLILAGVALTFVHLGARVLASTVEGGGASYVVAVISPFVIFPARVILVTGIVNLMLAAVPKNMSNDADTRPQAIELTKHG